MQNRGLSNRFSPEVRMQWTEWYACMVCGMNQWNCLHHIICPSESFYIKGEHNESVFNSSPLHNYMHPSATQMAKKGAEGFGITLPCHVGNEAWLYKIENAKYLLKQTAKALESMDYQPKEIDRTFLRVYADLYV